MRFLCSSSLTNLIYYLCREYDRNRVAADKDRADLAEQFLTGHFLCLIQNNIDMNIKGLEFSHKLLVVFQLNNHALAAGFI